MLWAALLPSDSPSASGSAPEAAVCSSSPTRLAELALWALQFTPRVARLDEAVLMELAASQRLFGGRRPLRARVHRLAQAFGVARIGWAPNALAALAFARAGVGNGFARPLVDGLDRLPLAVLSAAAPHQGTLARLGCRTLGDLRRLPRQGLGRRFDAALLRALDQAYGLQPEAHDWVAPPEVFCARLELPARVEEAPALMLGAHQLLLQLSGWLAARQLGVTALVLRWAHDAMRSRDAGLGGELRIRTGSATRRVEHLARLLGEHLAHTELLAPVGDLELQALDVQPLAPPSGSLLPDEGSGAAALDEALERLAARLGPARVLRPVLDEDHRPEWMQHWQAATEAAGRSPTGTPTATTPQPAWLLPQPIQLLVRQHRPVYRRTLQLIAGPHRVEGGWWHRAGEQHHHVQRDYFVALDEEAGVLWVFQQRLADERTAWYLHGVFA